MGLIVTLIIGGVIGWLASLLMKTGAQMGIIANIVVGIVGAALGFWLAGALGIVAVGSVAAHVVSPSVRRWPHRSVMSLVLWLELGSG